MDVLAPPQKSSQTAELLKIFQNVIPHEKWRLLEIGAGSGHQAVYLASRLPDLQWVTSDLAHRQNAIRKVIKQAGLPNVHGPIEFEVGKDGFPNQKFNAAYASHLIQTISWKQTKTLIKLLGNRLRKGSQVMFHGPFKYGGKFESARLEETDRELKARDPQSGIRAFEDISKAMAKAGFLFKKDFRLANENHLLFFERLEHLT